MTGTSRRRTGPLPTARVVAALTAALVVAVAVDAWAGAAVPGRMAAFALASTYVLVLGAKGLGAAVLQRPLRPDEHGDDEHAGAAAGDDEAGRG